MKRSTNMKALTIGLLTVSAFALAACQQEEATAFNFTSVEQCISASRSVDAGFTAQECRDGFAAAQKSYTETAPKYASQNVCEAEHGDDACTVVQGSDGSSIFVPMMVGYMMGSMMADKDTKRRSYTYVPMYSVKGGGYATSTGYYTSSLGTKSSMSTSTFYSKPASTVKAAPMTSVSVASKGGFGGVKAGGGGFGGAKAGGFGG